MPAVVMSKLFFKDKAGTEGPPRKYDKSLLFLLLELGLIPHDLLSIRLSLLSLGHTCDFRVSIWKNF
jgi:hypothetical protein